MTAASLMVTVGADVDGAMSGLSAVDGRVRGVSRSMRYGLLAAGAGVAAGFGMMITAAADFETSLNTMKAVTGATGSEMKLVSAHARALGADITLPGTSAKDAADAMTELAKGGLSVGQSMSAARGVLQLSAAAQIDNASAATITARALNSFGLAGNQATRVADLLAAGSNASTAEIGDLAQGMQMASSVFRQGRQPIDSLVTGLGLMANAGIAGSDAGTSLKTMMMSLMAPSDKAAAALKGMGVSVYDAQGSMRPMRDLIGQFTAATSQMGQEQRNTALATIFGTDAIRGANNVLTAGVASWDSMNAAVGRHGAAADLASAKMSGFNGALEAFKSTVQTLAIDFGSILLPALTSGLNAFTALTGVLGAHKDVVLAIVGPVAAFVAVLGGAALAVAGFSAAMTVLNVVMAANPWVLAIAALAALGVALVMAYRHSEAFRNIVNAAWAAVRNYVIPAAAAILAAVKAAWDAIQSTTTTVFNAVRAFISAHWDAIKAVTTGALTAIRTTVTTVWAAIGETVRAALAVISAIVTTNFNVIKGIVQTVMALIRGDWSGAWDAMKATAIAAITGAIAVVRALLTNFVPAVLALALQIGEGILKGIKTGLATLGSMLAAELAKIPEAIATAAGLAYSAAVHIGSQIVSGVLSGLSGLGGAIASKVQSAVSSALSHISIPGFSPVDQAAAKAIGFPLARGAVEGFLSGTRGLGDVLSGRVADALASAQGAAGSLALNAVAGVSGTGSSPVPAAALGNGAYATPTGGAGELYAEIHTHAYLDSREVFHKVRNQGLRFGKRNVAVGLS